MPIVIDYVNEIISITSPTTEVDGQELHDFIQDEAATPVGMGQPWIDQADPQDDTEILYPDGKIEDPDDPGVYSQIILRLNPRWQIQFWGGSGYTIISGAKFVGGLGGQVMKATGTAGDITVLKSPVDGVTVGVGGLSSAQNSQLMGLDTDNLDVPVSNIDTKVDLARNEIADIDADLAGVEAKIDVVDGNVDDIETISTSIEAKIDIMDAVIDIMNTNIVSIENKIDIMDAIIDSMSTKIDNIESGNAVIEAGVEIIRKLTGNKATRLGNVITFWEDDGATPFRSYDISLGGRVLV